MSEPASASDAVQAATMPHAHPGDFYSWVATVDHKRIGILYLLTARFFSWRAALRRC